MATLMAIDGTTTEVTVNKDSKLQELQAMVGGLIEFYGFRDGSTLMVNEEGKLRGMEINKAATALTAEKGRSCLIVGPAVFMSAAEVRDMDNEED